MIIPVKICESVGSGVKTKHVRALLAVPALHHLVERYVGAGLQKTLEGSLEIAYHASMLKNEGRNLRFALIFDLEGRRGGGQVQQFRHPIELTSKQLQSISTAFSPDSYCFVIAPSPRHQASPVIVGTVARPRSAFPSPQLYHPLVVIDVEAPGVIALSVGDAKAVFRRGEIHEPSRGIQGISMIVEVNIFVEEVCNAARLVDRSVLHSGPEILELVSRCRSLNEAEFRSILKRAARRIYDQTLQIIARKMVRSRCGGAVLLLPRLGEREGLFHGGRWYQAPDLQIHRELTRVLALEGVYRFACMGKILSAGSPSSDLDQAVSWANERIRPSLRSALAGLDQACQHCAELTQADGATVLGTDFGIEGFSAKLTSYQGILPEPLAVFLETRGNRHRSTAGAIAGQPGAIGLVVSQDGEITVFTHPRMQQPRHIEIVL
jgi:hypothetical protein